MTRDSRRLPASRFRESFPLTRTLSSPGHKRNRARTLQGISVLAAILDAPRVLGIDRWLHQRSSRRSKRKNGVRKSGLVKRICSALECAWL
jgi:hypothetical protein